MNPLKKGPELKLPDLKVPDFALDVYYDLKERHLLPLVAILLVALVALPITLGKSSGSAGEASSAVATEPGATPPRSKLVVAKATPGLRDYRHRLEGVPRNPFKQRYASAPEEADGQAPSAGGASGSEGDGTGGGAANAPSPESGGGASPAPSGESGNGEPPEGGHLQYYSWAIDVRVTPVSSKSKQKGAVRRNLPGMTMLPSRKVPALTFVGVSKDEKNAVMLVSDKVTGLFGDATCVEGSERCQLIALEPGIPETVVYGANARSYRIELLELRLLKTDELNTSPLGKKQRKGGEKSEQSLGEGFAGTAPAATASR